MTGIEQFLAMGGYARFVWPAYGVAILVLSGMATLTLRNWRRHRRAVNSLNRDASQPSR